MTSDKKIARPSVLKQVLAAITCNLLSFNIGTTNCWGGRNYMLLTSEDSPLESGPLSTSEASLVVSIPSFGAMCGTFTYTILMNRLRRKTLLVSVAILHISSWLVLLITSNMYCLYASRLVMGFVNGGTMKVIPIYVAEIADDKVRGALNSMLAIFCNAGLLFAFASPSFLDFYGQIKVNMISSSLFLILFNFFLVNSNQQHAMEKSKCSGEKPSFEKKNIDQLDEDYETNTSLMLSDFCNPVAKRAIMIALFLGVINQFCGAFAIINYTNKIFEEAGSSLPSSTASIIVGAVQLFANCVTMVLVDRAGRKILMILSTLGTAVGLVSMGLFELYKEQLNAHRWIPIVAFSTVIFCASVGIFPLTFVILSEISPNKIKNVVSFLCLEAIYVIAFGLLSFYPTLTIVLGAATCMFIFAGCCLLGTVFCVIILPETKGKSHEEIMKALEKSTLR